MEYDEGKVDETVLALLHLTSWTEQGFVRAWKGHDWDALNRLHESGLISTVPTLVEQDQLFGRSS